MNRARPPPRAHRALCALFGAVAAWPYRVEAHQINLWNARVELQADRVVKVEVALKGSDADRVAGTKVFDEQSGLVDSSRLAGTSAPIAAYEAAHAVVQGADGTLCEAGPVTVDADQDGVIARLTWSCRKISGDLFYRSTVLIDIDRTAKGVSSAAGRTPRRRCSTHRGPRSV